MKIEFTLKGSSATTEEAINVYSGGVTKLLANLIDMLMAKDILTIRELEEIFDWEVSAEEEIRF